MSQPPTTASGPTPAQAPSPAQSPAPEVWTTRHIPFLHYLGMRKLRADGNEAVVSLELNADLLNNHGAGHGGVVMTLLDAAMASAALSRADFKREVVTISMNIGFIRPAAGTLYATGRATGGGKSICFCEGEIVDDSGTVVAQSQGTFRYRERANRDGQPSCT